MQKFDKSVEKKRLRNFWTTRWSYMSIESWLLHIGRTSKNLPSRRIHCKNIISDGLRKLTLEKKITEEELSNLLVMTDSSDDENKTIVLLVMQKYKKTKFKKT